MRTGVGARHADVVDSSFLKNCAARLKSQCLIKRPRLALRVQPNLRVTEFKGVGHQPLQDLTAKPLSPEFTSDRQPSNLATGQEPACRNDPVAYAHKHRVGRQRVILVMLKLRRHVLFTHEHRHAQRQRQGPKLGPGAQPYRFLLRFSVQSSPQ